MSLYFFQIVPNQITDFEINLTISLLCRTSVSIVSIMINLNSCYKRNNGTRFAYSGINSANITKNITYYAVTYNVTYKRIFVDFI